MCKTCKDSKWVYVVGFTMPKTVDGVNTYNINSLIIHCPVCDGVKLATKCEAAPVMEGVE